MKPDLTTLNINLLGVVYTSKLAMHYFHRQESSGSRDRCLILQGSLAGYIDLPGSVQYNASKFGVRGILCSLRRIMAMQGMRVNYIGPWSGAHEPLVMEESFTVAISALTTWLGSFGRQ